MFDLKKCEKAMSKEYLKLWNAKVQKKIDSDIEANRKADAKVELSDIKVGTEVKVEQLSHKFVFGAHIFNFDQLGTDERNEKYKELYGTFFNSATVAFYWKCFEPVEGETRFAGTFRDTAEFWNTVAEPKKQSHWRRPAADPVVEFCESKNIRIHGHPLTWGNGKWHYPEWILSKLPSPYREQMSGTVNMDVNPTVDIFKEFSAGQIEKMFPEFALEINTLTAKRIMDIAMHYGNRIPSWDVVNESAHDYSLNLMHEGSSICKSTYGLMPGDYTYRSFKIADGVFPKDVQLNINDYFLNEHFANQTLDLLDRGCKIDIMGAQMHLFNPQTCLDIADGKSEVQSPESVRETFDTISKAGLPIHLSEITITAPNNDERGQAIQAVIARNLYRLWFSLKPMMGITWWNVVDDCGAPGEPSVSGLFSRDMEPKTAFHALNDLIYREWMTKLSVKADKKGVVEFRGFRGRYRLTWKGADGEIKMKFVDVE